MSYVPAPGGLRVSAPLHEFVRDRACPGSGIAPDSFWASFATLLRELTAENRALLARREELQERIDAWHRDRRGRPHDAAEYKAFLRRVGYLEPEGPDFRVETEGVDDEIALTAGPQLVVPATNARYALNAANARWGSLYDALYGTDAVAEDGGRERGPPGHYNPRRGLEVVRRAAAVLDEAAPLAGGARHADVTAYSVDAGGRLAATLVAGGAPAGLADPAQLVGFRGDAAAPSCLLLRRHGLHVEVRVDRAAVSGKQSRAGVADVVVESALSAILDLEDSSAAVDGADKALVYGTFLGLMRGDLEVRFSKGGKEVRRVLKPDRRYRRAAGGGGELVLPGRSVMLVRNVGHLMTTPAVLDADGREVFEGLLDAAMTALVARHNLGGRAAFTNSRAGSVYVVKPKMHGPAEVRFAVRTLELVERAMGLRPLTLKIGVMDEERRLTVNLKECLRAARLRVAFINTGFLDRTGDEYHTSMEAGPLLPKGDMKGARWRTAYEDWNVDVGIACGLRGRAQIGKGMWAAPSAMASMLREKIGHLRAGASCAWVPSPTAATLHALHYLRYDVAARQRELAAGGRRASVDDLLAVPLASPAEVAALTPERLRAELDNNAQSILGYVVRWVDQGIGCSTVPDLAGLGLMEDRATLRISSQSLANWLLHGVVTREQVVETFRRMAAVVDRQNAGDRRYTPMAPACNGVAFNAALDLVLKGRGQPSGYTEPLLHAARLEFKRRAGRSSRSRL